MTAEAARTVAAAFISCLSDYCNLLLYGLPGTLLRKLQTMHNSTAGLITGTQGHGHITPALRTPLTAHSRVCQVQSGMSGLPVAVWAGASLLGRWLLPRVWQHSSLTALLSADILTCVVLRTLSSYGDRTFAAVGPRLWNSLSVQLRNPDITYELFRRRLKGHLFQETW